MDEYKHEGERAGSKEMYEDLGSFGIVPRKSLIMKFPNNIPKEYFGDWLRGYFDGDGCVRRLSKWHLDCTFVSGSKQFLEGLRDALTENFGITHREIKATKGDDVNYFVLRYNKDDQLKLYGLMYHANMGDLYLQRKKDIFDSQFLTKH